MNVIAPRTLHTFWEKHPHAEESLRDWLKLMQKGEFTDFASVRAVWPHADLVRARGDVPVVVFNVGGNKYRLVASLNWTYRAVYVKHIVTHPGYDAWNRKGRPL